MTYIIGRMSTIVLTACLAAQSMADEIFLATAVPANGDAPLNVGRNGNIQAADDNGEQTWWVLCYDKATGMELWRQAARKGTPKAM